MTKLQKIRESLIKQLENIENNKSNIEDVNSIIGIADVITRTYNTELRAKELELDAENKFIKLSDLDVFQEM